MNATTATTARQLDLFEFFQPAEQPPAPRSLEVRTASGRVLVLIDEEPPPRNPIRTDPAAPDYNEGERLPPEWRPLVGAVLHDDRRTVGSLADVLEALAPAVRDEWRALLEAESRVVSPDGSELVRTYAATRKWEEAHGIVWDSYGCNLQDTATGEWIVEQW